MKTTKLAFLAILFAGCTTAELRTARAIADPIINAALSGYASAYGVPPVITAGVMEVVEDQLWGMLAQAYKKQPIAQGSAVPEIGAAVAKADAQRTTPTVQLLTTAIASLKSVQP